jgi:hypothetical protein
MNAGAVVVTIEAITQGLKKGFQDAIQETKNAGNTIRDDISSRSKQASENVTSTFAGIGKGISVALVTGTALAIGGLALVGKGALDSASKFEMYEATLKVMLGTQEKAQQRMKDYAEFAKTTPFELPQVVELGNQLQAIGKYSKENMTNLGDLAAASGKPIEQVTGAFAKLATGQKGIAVDMFRDLLISTDDWVKATGKGVDKTGSLMATTDQMLQALPEIMKNKNFTGMMATQAETFTGKMSNLTDTFQGKLLQIGNFLLPKIKPIIDQLIVVIGNINIEEIFNGAKNAVQAVIDTGTNLVKWASDNEAWLTPLAIIIGSVATAWAVWNIAIGIYTFAIGIATLATTAFGVVVAIATSPITLIGLAIGALIAIVWILYKNWDTVTAFFSVAMSIASNGVKYYIDQIGNYFNWLGEKASTVGNTIGNAFKGIGNGIKNGIKTAINWVIERINWIIEQINNVSGSISNASGGVVSMGQVNTLPSLQFAKGGDFITDGPVPIMVGDNAGGKERVSVTPISSPNINGPKNNGGYTLINQGTIIADRKSMDKLFGNNRRIALQNQYS